MLAKPPAPIETEEYPVTDYDFAYLGTTLNFRLEDGVDTLVWAVDPESNMPAVIITQFNPPSYSVLFVNQMQGYRHAKNVHKRVVKPRSAQ